MPPELREALRGLCCGHGWSYGALWRPDRRDPWFLMMEDCYYEEHIRSVIENMRDQVHMVGEGTLGVAAISGKHQWIYSDTCINSCLTIPGDDFDMFQGNAEWQCQFIAGIKTVAIISLPSFGVVQFGSSQKIPQNLKLVDQVQRLFRKLETVTGLFLHLDAYKTANTPVPPPAFASVISNNGNINSLHDEIGEVQLANTQSSKSQIRPSNFFSLGSHHGTSSNSGTMNPRVLAMPVISSSSGASKYSNSSVSENSPFHLTYPFQTASTEAQALLSPTIHLRSNFSAPHMNTSNRFGGGYSESCGPHGSQGMMPLKSYRISKPCSYGAEKLLDFQHSSCSSFPVSDLSTGNSFPRAPSFTPELPDIIHSSNQPLEQVNDVPTVLMNNDVGCSRRTEFPSELESFVASALNSLDTGSDWKANTLDNELFDGMEFDLSRRILGHSWDDIILSVGSGSCSNLTTGVVDCIDVESIEDVGKGFFSESTLEKLMDDVIVGGGPQSHINHEPLVGHPSLIRRADVSLPEGSLEKIMQGSPKESFVKSQVSSWIDDGCSVNAESAVIDQPKKPEEAVKVARKRARPGESTRPRPKDRQQIQDRVKELREIVPNGAKCSIDSLLDRTIKHMLFLQSVTKYADKLKQPDEPKMIGDESGVVLRDNLSGGGATWAYEVAGQTMVCPILVEDLNPPGQMLVEMLCEERGFFLEIADVIRGFGLTILKGVMETRDRKIWARFLVEANRDVTRMDIFLSLVQLLQQASCVRSGDQPTRVIEKGVPAFTNYRQSPAPIPISLADGFQ